MYNYSPHSLAQRRSLQPHLREVLSRTLETDDHRIDQGGRSDDEQWAYYNAGTSTLRPPNGKHLIQSDGYAYAADVCPYLNGVRLATDKENFGPYQMAQFAWFLRKVKEVSIVYLAEIEAISGERWELRFGVDWDGDNEILTDQKFQDWFHVELVKLS